MRIIIYTGENQVGKTTMAYQSALKFSKDGYKTLFVSTNELKYEQKPMCIKENLWHVAISSHNEDWEIVNHWLRKIMKWEKLNGVSTDEIPFVPGIKQIIYLIGLNQYIKSQEFDILVVDIKLMDEVYRLLSYPELLESWVERLFKSEKYFLKMVRPLTKVVPFGFEVPSHEVMSRIEVLMKEFHALQKVILNPKITTLRLVLTPRESDIENTRRLFTYLNMFGYLIDGILINKRLPETVSEGYFKNWLEYEKDMIEEIENSFKPIPIYQVELKDKPITNQEIIEELLSLSDFEKVLYDTHLYKFTKEEEGYLLEIQIDEEMTDYTYHIEDHHLYIEGQTKHIIYLPKVLTNKNIVRTEVFQHVIHIIFI